jgi:hypothetical protein
MPGGERLDLDHHQLWRPAVLPRWPLLRHRATHRTPISPRWSPRSKCSGKPASTWTPTTLVVFQGYDNRCRKKLFGLVNCCKGAGSDGSLFSNLNLILGAGGQVMGASGRATPSTRCSRPTRRTWPSPASRRCSERGRLLRAGRPHGRRPLGGILHRDPGTRPLDHRHAGDPALGHPLLRAGRTDPRHEARQPLCHGVGSYCSSRLPIIRLCIETTEILLLLQLAPGPHPQRAGARPARPRLGWRRKPRLQRLHRRAAAGARLLAHGPRGVLRRDRARPCPTSERVNSYFGP